MDHFEQAQRGQGQLKAVHGEETKEIGADRIGAAVDHPLGSGTNLISRSRRGLGAP